MRDPRWERRRAWLDKGLPSALCEEVMAIEDALSLARGEVARLKQLQDQYGELWKAHMASGERLWPAAVAQRLAILDVNRVAFDYDGFPMVRFTFPAAEFSLGAEFTEVGDATRPKGRT